MCTGTAPASRCCHAACATCPYVYPTPRPARRVRYRQRCQRRRLCGWRPAPQPNVCTAYQHWLPRFARRPAAAARRGARAQPQRRRHGGGQRLKPSMPFSCLPPLPLSKRTTITSAWPGRKLFICCFVTQLPAINTCKMSISITKSPGACRFLAMVFWQYVSGRGVLFLVLGHGPWNPINIDVVLPIGMSPGVQPSLPPSSKCIVFTEGGHPDARQPHQRSHSLAKATGCELARARCLPHATLPSQVRAGALLLDALAATSDHDMLTYLAFSRCCA